MKAYNKIIWAGAILAMCSSTVVQAEAYFGAGASFPNVVYSAWGKEYKAQSNNTLVYSPVGSGKGLAAIVAKRTDFGASDKPLSKDEQEKYQLVQFPMVIGGVVPAVNLKGIADGQLQLDGAVLAQIYLGRITRWNDAAIAAMNPGLALPNQAINVISRADKSGTTFNLSNYLSKVSPEWKATMGEGLTVAWKTGMIAEDHDEQVTKFTATPNAIACLDYADMKKRHLTGVRMKNRDGVFVGASVKAFQAAAEALKWNAVNGFAEELTEQPGKETWPITTATYILLDRTGGEPVRQKELLSFFDWAYRQGDEVAYGSNFVPLPKHLKDLVRGEWISKIRDAKGNSVWSNASL